MSIVEQYADVRMRAYQVNPLGEAVTDYVDGTDDRITDSYTVTLCDLCWDEYDAHWSRIGVPFTQKDLGSRPLDCHGCTS